MVRGTAICDIRGIDVCDIDNDECVADNVFLPAEGRNNLPSFCMAKRADSRYSNIIDVDV